MRRPLASHTVDIISFHRITMGIDIYARYPQQPHEQIEEQISEHWRHWLDPTAGDIGYLREAYHGEPYGTRFFVAEAFETGEALIPAATLRKRLPEALRLARERERRVYHETSRKRIQPILDSYTGFVEFCERIERETGHPATIIASY